MKKIILLFVLAFAASTGLRAQLFVDTAYTADQMIHGFFDNAGVTISNITYTGIPASLGFFEGSQSNIGMNAGLLMTTGAAVNAIGPNDSESESTTMGVPGSPWLDALIPGYYTYDASVITMDVVPSTDTLTLQYVFGSEEYQEYVNFQYNDLFALLIEGPGLPQGDSIWVAPNTIYITNDSACYVCVDTFFIVTDTICYFDSLQMQDTCYYYQTPVTSWCYYIPGCTGTIDTIVYPGYWYYSPGGVNIALVPNTNLPVAINNLNQFINSQYFIDNNGGSTVQYDAFTTPLWATIPVQAGQTYQVRIAIADAGDQVFDSGVFLGIQSMGGDSLLPTVPNYNFVASPSSTTVNFANASFWATEYHWDFGDGTTSTEKSPIHDYAQPGLYTVTLVAKNWCSANTYVQEVAAGVTGTQEPARDVFTAAPNPTNGVFNLNLKKESGADVRISNLSGQLLFERHLDNGKTQFDLNRFGKGVYVLQVVSEGQVYSEKIVNQ